MRSKLLTLAIILFSFTCHAQAPTDWSRYQWLMGDWKSESKPGQPTGTFSFALDLNRNILVRKSHTELPAVHEDMLIIYSEHNGSPLKAIYFDNEGHTINYAIYHFEKTIIMTSEKIPDMPRFRLTYIQLSPETIKTKFEISKDGETFTTYIEGNSNKVH